MAEEQVNTHERGKALLKETVMRNLPGMARDMQHILGVAAPGTVPEQVYSLIQVPVPFGLYMALVHLATEVYGPELKARQAVAAAAGMTDAEISAAAGDKRD